MRPAGSGAQFTSMVFEGAHSEQVLWPAGSIYFQGLSRRGHSCRDCLRDRGRTGLNLLLGSWFARARVQRRVAACGVSGSIYFQGLDWRGRAPRACVVARGSGGSIYFQGLDWRAAGGSIRRCVQSICCGPRARGAQSTSKVSVGAVTRAENVVVASGARGLIYFQVLGRRGNGRPAAPPARSF